LSLNGVSLFVPKYPELHIKEKCPDLHIKAEYADLQKKTLKTFKKGL
jgi:hypothetical protein